MIRKPTRLYFLEDRGEDIFSKLIDSDLVGVGNLGQNDYVSAWDIASCAIKIGDCAGVKGIAVYDHNPVASGSAGQGG